MDVDDPARHLLAHFIRKDLHVASQDDELGAGLANNAHLFSFSLCFVLLGYLDEVIRNAMAFYYFLEIQMVRDHANDVDRQSPNAPTIE
ncbi:hypothetical protein D3C84_906810 [compost metagenome]